jgi:hypothetical protein
MTTSANFQRGRDLIRRLHDLIARAADESPEGDAVREEMDLLWPQLQPDEVRLLSGLSADLYSFTDQEIKDERYASTRAGEVEGRLADAYRAGRYDETLELLRYPGAATLPSEAVAFVRSRCWEGLGDLEIALWFMERSARHPSRNGVLVLHLLDRLRHHDARRAKAREYIDAPDAHPDVTLASISALYQPAAPAQELEGILSAASRALDKLLVVPAADRNPHLGLIGVAAVAATRRVLSKARNLIEAYAPLVDAYGVFDFVWTAYGLDLAGTDRARAVEAFARAIDLRTSLFYPYRLMAQWAIEAGDYRSAIAVCVEAAPNLKERDLAQVLELHAVATFLEGNGDAVATALLRDATALSPFDIRLADNYRRVQAGEREPQMFQLPGLPPWRRRLVDPPPAEPHDLAA